MAARSASASGAPSARRGPAPTLSAAVRPASSMRATRPPASVAMSRPPTFMAAVWTIRPPATSANFVVPPPMSTFSTACFGLRDSLTEPEPWAASADSRLCPAEAHTNFPASLAKISAMARALRRLIASPVRMIAPLSTSSGRVPASA